MIYVIFIALTVAISPLHAMDAKVDTFAQHIEHLIDTLQDIDQPSVWGTQTAIMAVVSYDPYNNLLKRILDRGAHIKWDLLAYAADGGASKNLYTLLEESTKRGLSIAALVHHPYVDTSTFILACKHDNRYPAVKYIIEHDSELSSENIQRGLYAALYRGAYRNLAILLNIMQHKYPTLINMQRNSSRNTLLCTAIPEPRVNSTFFFLENFGKLICVELLCRYGANPHIKNQDGFSPIHYACEVSPQDKRFVALLLRYGANPEEEKKWHTSPDLKDIRDDYDRLKKNSESLSTLWFDHDSYINRLPIELVQILQKSVRTQIYDFQDIDINFTRKNAL